MSTFRIRHDHDKLDFQGRLHPAGPIAVIARSGSGTLAFRSRPDHTTKAGTYAAPDSPSPRYIGTKSSDGRRYTWKNGVMYRATA